MSFENFLYIAEVVAVTSLCYIVVLYIVELLFLKSKDKDKAN